MSNREKTPLLPKLRFAQFADQPWRAVCLGDVTAESTTRNGGRSQSMEVMGVTKAKGIVPMEERVIGADRSRYKVVRKNWFAYNPMRLNIGSIARWHGDQDILVSPDYVVFRCIEGHPHGIASDFLDHFRTSDRWQDFMTESGLGSVRVRIYYKDIARLELSLPKIAEQKKIADCLSSLDKLIDAHACKVEALKTHRKRLMQQLFPREGETRPRLRFPELRDAMDWRQKTLGAIAEIKSGSTPSRSNDDFFSGGTIPWVKTTDLNNSFVTRTEESITPKARARINLAGSILLAMYGGFKQIGRTGCLTFPAATNQAISVLQLDRKVALPTYVLAWLNAKVNDWKRIASSSRKVPNITRADVAKFPIALPGVHEQKLIAHCLTSLDDLISAAANELEILQAHKKGLMHQLFPSVEALDA